MLQDAWKFPWTLSVKNFWYSLKINVTGYVEISMDHLIGKNIFELVSMLQDARKFPWTLSVQNFWISLSVTGYMEISLDP